MILNARDDPFIDPAALKTAAAHTSTNPNVIITVTEAGGKRKQGRQCSGCALTHTDRPHGLP